MTFQPGKIKYDEVAGNLSFCLDIRLEYLKKAKKRSLEQPRLESGTFRIIVRFVTAEPVYSVFLVTL